MFEPTRMGELEAGDMIISRGRPCIIEMIQGRNSPRLCLAGTDNAGYHVRLYFEPGDTVLAQKRQAGRRQAGNGGQKRPKTPAIE